MDIYIVLDSARVVGVSARFQGAELIRVTESERIAFRVVRKLIIDRRGEAYSALITDEVIRANGMWATEQRLAYGRMRIENHNVQDMED